MIDEVIETVYGKIFGTRMALALENDNYDKACRILKKAATWRAKRYGTSVEDENKLLLKALRSDIEENGSDFKMNLLVSTYEAECSKNED